MKNLIKEALDGVKKQKLQAVVKKSLEGKMFHLKHIKGFIRKIDFLPNPERVYIYIEYTITTNTHNATLKGRWLSEFNQAVREEITNYGFDSEVYPERCWNMEELQQKHAQLFPSKD
jgi:hypothetical protein